MFMGHLVSVLGPISKGVCEFFSMPFQEGFLRRLRDVLAPRRPLGESNPGNVQFGRSLAILKHTGRSIIAVSCDSLASGERSGEAVVPVAPQQSAIFRNAALLSTLLF